MNIIPHLVVVSLLSQIVLHALELPITHKSHYLQHQSEASVLL